MDRLHALQVFVAVADAGSFAGAAVRLRLSPPAVTRAVAALEERLGARLFSRTTRSLAITEVGQRLLASARRILADLETAEREAVGAAAAPQGHLAVTASVTFGRLALAPVVGDFLARHPRVRAAVLLLDRVTSLVEGHRCGGAHRPPAGLHPRRQADRRGPPTEVAREIWTAG